MRVNGVAKGARSGVITQLGWTGDISTKSVAPAGHTLSQHGAPCRVVGGIQHWTQTSSAASPLQVSWDGRVALPCTAPRASDPLSSFSPAPSSLCASSPLPQSPHSSAQGLPPLALPKLTPLGLKCAPLPRPPSLVLSTHPASPPGMPKSLTFPWHRKHKTQQHLWITPPARPCALPCLLLGSTRGVLEATDAWALPNQLFRIQGGRCCNS